MINEITLKKLKAIGYKPIQVLYTTESKYNVDFMMVKGRNVSLQIQNKESGETFYCHLMFNTDLDELDLIERNTVIVYNSYIGLRNDFKLFIFEKMNKIVLGTKGDIYGDCVLLYPSVIGGIRARENSILTDASIVKYMYLVKEDRVVEIDNSEGTVGLYDLVNGKALIHRVHGNTIEILSERLGSCEIKFYETKKNMVFDLCKV